MTDCPICYEEVTAETGTVSLSCKHTFHLACITHWFSKQDQGSCPCCRKAMGEKEDTAHLTKDDDTLTYHSESDSGSDSGSDSSSEEECLVFTVSVTREKLSSILNKMPNNSFVKEVGTREWSHLLESRYYSCGTYDGEDCIIFSYDELRSYVMTNCWQDLPRSIWNDLVKEQCSTVSLNHTQMVSLQLEIDNDSLTMPKEEWKCMIESDMYMKEEPEYAGESRIRFTYAQLSGCIINTCWEDLTWKKWKELCENEKTPLTGAFASASLDFSIPIYLPTNLLRPTIKSFMDLFDESKIVSEIPELYEIDSQISYIKKLLQEPVTDPLTQSFTGTRSSPIIIIDGRRRIHAISNFYHNLFPVNGTYFFQMGEGMSLFMQHRLWINIVSA